ncbi:MAG: fibronectin type III domain-containing protein [Flavobacteriaceae bacterium]|nr:fibronectin type III domain-containing protein [Flavobacteriaceae bacterium]
MKKITLAFVFSILGMSVYSQCPIPATSFVGDYNMVQTTPNHPENGGPSFNSQVVSINAQATPNSRVFSALYLEFLNIPGQTPTTINFTLDCPNGNSVIVGSGINTFLGCGVGSITLGPASITGVFDVNDDTSFTLVLAEYVTDGGCGVPTPLVTEFQFTKASCGAPQNINFSNITATTADVSWTDVNGTGTTFDVEYGVEGFTLGTGTTQTNLSATNTTLTGLQEGTFYDVYVTADCGGGTSSLTAGPISLLVPADCNTIFSGFPIVEIFDDAAVFASCYTVIDQDANGTAWIQQELELTAGIPSFFATNGTNTATKEDYLFSPAIQLTAGQTYTISATYNGADASATGLANEDLEVLVATGNTVTDANAGTSVFTDTGIVQNGAGLADVEVQAITNSGQFTATTTGDHYIVFKSTGSPAPGSTTTGFLLLFEYSIDTTLSVGDFDQNQFNFFVDANNTLNLEATNIMEQLQVFNIVGQQVINTNLNATEAQVSVNVLKPGVYLAKLQLEGENRSFKFVKR